MSRRTVVLNNTVSFLGQNYPEVKLIVNKNSLGSIASRDRMLRECRSELVLSLDDDSYPEQINSLELLEVFFQSNSDVSLAHFPQRTDECPDTIGKTCFGGIRETGSYANSGACYRRIDYLQTAGFISMFFHAYEEPDYCLQLLEVDKKVLYYPGITIRHHYSPRERNELWVHHQHARNELWAAIIRCPLVLLPVIIPYRLISQARYATSRGWRWLVREPIWWWAAIRGLAKIVSKRHPVSVKTYRTWMRLLRAPAG